MPSSCEGFIGIYENELFISLDQGILSVDVETGSLIKFIRTCQLKDGRSFPMGGVEGFVDKNNSALILIGYTGYFILDLISFAFDYFDIKMTTDMPNLTRGYSQNGRCVLVKDSIAYLAVNHQFPENLEFTFQAIVALDYLNNTVLWYHHLETGVILESFLGFIDNSFYIHGLNKHIYKFDLDEINAAIT